TALDSLPPGLREAGRGIGMTFWQRLRWVEIPMALPVIFGGIRHQFDFESSHQVGEVFGYQTPPDQDSRWSIPDTQRQKLKGK
ncbi:ABC transporter permease subunit, partial [Salmonella enterica subsp. enterica serovar Montevideo]|nr:ABC transporter permease subunit [Salmonella enterica subsp. enterica serovar Montevideo]